MNAIVLPFRWRLGSTNELDGLHVEVRFRDSYDDERLSPGEIEALSPVLPELAAELLMIMATDSMD